MNFIITTKVKNVETGKEVETEVIVKKTNTEDRIIEEDFILNCIKFHSIKSMVSGCRFAVYNTYKGKR